MKNRIHPCHYGLLAICIIAILLGYFTARANGATTSEEPPAWSLLKQQLGKEPTRADAVDLGVALRKSLKARPDLLIPLVQTSAALACKLKYSKAAMLMVLQIAAESDPSKIESCISAAYNICPDSTKGVAEKIIIATPDYEASGTPLWTPPDFPPMVIFSPVTPVVDTGRKK